MTQNALDPDRMSAAERLDEIARNLAAGLVRLRNRRAPGKFHYSNELREGSLAFPTRKSVYGLRTRDDGEGR